MKTDSSTVDRRGVPWTVAGVVFLVLVVFLMWQFRRETDSTKELAFKANRVDIVGRMELALASASEAEKSAVLAITDQDSQTLADQARAATAEVERERQELGKLLATGGTKGEQDLLSRFSEAFGDLRRIDEEVLRLAVRNSNLKAFALAFGPAADTLTELDTALSRVAAKRAGAPGAMQVLRLASDARIGLLRIQVLLAPHIAEESDAKMDQMEASMTREWTKVREDLDGLAALPGLKGDADLATAASTFARYGELKAQILALSRENTNVRSLALSLNQKRKAMTVSLDALNALRQAILDEPIAGVDYGRPPHPR
jgi:hypothetical protein